MKSIYFGLILSIFALSAFPVFADGHGHHKSALHIQDAWSPPTIGKSKNGIIYLHIKNTGKKEITITAANSEVSARAELHTHIKDGDVMKMRALKNGITIGAGGTAELKPGGKHIMLMGLKKPLAAGEQFTVELITKSGKTHAVEISVQDMTQGKHGHGGSHKGH